ncbi:hypothetical protein GRI97_06295 [Altererythrobacter xixiisoli]|uniref:Uncharacterized protein n=2 Tax=Croceibacterium xixiisoli TaxID=1476466 RepID=A0A6I4TRL4_9SPHN|nr:hypothetical protein [Croceibacterium xixiisoli]
MVMVSKNVSLRSVGGSRSGRIAIAAKDRAISAQVNTPANNEIAACDLTADGTIRWVGNRGKRIAAGRGIPSMWVGTASMPADQR